MHAGASARPSFGTFGPDRKEDRGTHLPQAGVDGTHQDPEGLAGAAPHGAKDLAQEGDEAQPPLDVGLLELLSPAKIPLSQREEGGEEKKHRVILEKESSTLTACERGFPVGRR